MFNRKTVFVLGAGASCHYDYPTGEGLVSAVIQKCSDLRAYFEAHQPPNMSEYVKRKIKGAATADAIRKAYADAVEECERLASRLIQINPLVIDYFLAHDPSLGEIGRFMIAWVILECEFTQRRRIAGHHNQVDWYRFLIHKLTAGISAEKSILSNRVKFVTFNYDASLDYYLYDRLSPIEVIRQTDVDSFLTDDRILHIYGSIRATPVGKYEPQDMSVVVAAAKQASDTLRPGVSQSVTHALDFAYQAGSRLRTIDPIEKDAADEILRQAREAIQEAEVVYIFGYGFDSRNSRRIGLYDHLPLKPGGYVLYTNLGDSQRINGEFANILFDDPRDRRQLTDHGTIIQKSIRTVYEALALDFNAPEEASAN